MIHATAIIDPDADLAEDVSVGPYSIVGAGVEIDRGTVIGSHVVINGPSRIGKQNQIFQFASIGGAPQDKRYAGEATGLVIGDRNVIREYATLSRGTVSTAGLGETMVGDDNLLMAYTHIAHDCRVGHHTIFGNAASLAGHVTVCDHAILSGFTLVHQFTTVGEKSFCGMGSVISRDIPPYSIAAGNRARVVGINKEGLKRHGYSPELIRALHQAFRELLKSRPSKPKTSALLDALYVQYQEVAVFINFIRQSKRGIAR